MEKGRLIGRGRTAEVYEWGENKVLKLFQATFPKNAIENEFEISMELWKKDLPVPEVDSLIELENRLGIVYERVAGRTMLAELSAKPWKVVENARKMAELHKSIQIEVNTPIPSEKDRLQQAINNSEMLTDQIKANLFAYLENLPESNILCHGDFHPDNIIISTDKMVIIDWITAAIGDPLSDAARTSVIFKYALAPDHKSKLETGIINFVRGKFFDEYLKHYRRLTGVSKESIEQWEVPIAAARLIEWVPHQEKERLLGLVTKHFNR